ncbi:acetyl-CoA carboxylase, carboxyltransferase subunit beta [Thermoproteota archaeon]
MDWFANKQKTKTANSKLNIPGDLWVKCFECGGILYLKELEANFKVCLKCNYHFRLTPEERIKFIFDPDTFKESEQGITPIDLLSFKDTELYEDRLKKAQSKTKRRDAVVVGNAELGGRFVNLALMDFGFMGGSMGSVVGEKVTRIIETAVKNKQPLIIFTASGGARMQEGIMSLMQMAKTSAALAKLNEAKVPYIVVLCDPTTGGTSASFAMLGDVMIAEPGALISFAGPRVIEQTIREKLPPGFQRAEFLLEHGMVDMVVERKYIRDTLINIVNILKDK